jgi:hypothetical protein
MRGWTWNTSVTHLRAAAGSVCRESSCWSGAKQIIVQ